MPVYNTPMHASAKPAYAQQSVNASTPWTPKRYAKNAPSQFNVKFLVAGRYFMSVISYHPTLLDIRGPFIISLRLPCMLSNLSPSSHGFTNILDRFTKHVSGTPPWDTIMWKKFYKTKDYPTGIKANMQVKMNFWIQMRGIIKRRSLVISDKDEVKAAKLLDELIQQHPDVKNFRDFDLMIFKTIGERKRPAIRKKFAKWLPRQTHLNKPRTGRPKGTSKPGRLKKRRKLV